MFGMEWLDLSSRDVLSVAADCLSFVSVATAGYAVVQIRRARADILNRVRLPEHIDSISQSKTRLQRNMGTDPDQRRRFRAELMQCGGILSVLSVKIHGPPKRRTKRIIRAIARYRGATWWGFVAQADSHDDAWRIYEELLGLLGELNNLHKDNQLGA